MTMTLAKTLADSGEHEIRVFGPPLMRGCEWLDEHYTPVQVDSKGSVAAGRRMRSMLRSWQPEVVHAQDRRSGLVVTGLDRLRGGPRVVVQTYHGVPDDVGESWFRGMERSQPPSIYSRTVLAADAVIARQIKRTVVPSSTMGEFLHSRLHVPRERLAHIDNGVHLPPAEPVVGPVRRLLFVGLLIPRKGLVDLLHALRRPGVMPVDATLTIAGDGPSRDEAEKLAQCPPLIGRVQFLGFRNDVADLMSRHDALVLPSRMEQQPLVIAQAMGAGRPVLATRTGGVPEMLEIPGLPHYLASPCDVDGLATALTRLFGSSHPDELGRKLASRARDRYSAAASAAAHLKLYDAMLT